MTYLVLLKRFEIWLLFGIVIGILVFAFTPEDSPEVVQEVAEPVVLTEAPPEEVVKVTPETPTEEPVENAPALVVDQVRSEATKGGQIIAVTLSARSPNGKEHIVDEKTIRAMTDTGVSVPRFFAPFQTDQVIPAEDTTRFQLKFWLAESESSEPASFLWLDFQGEKTQAEIPENG